MYSSLTLENFKGFQNLRLDNLPRINLIAGKNNVGKTSLLEAIGLLSGNFSPQLLLRTFFENGDKRALTRTETSQALPNWNVLFHDFEISRSINMMGTYERIFNYPSLFDMDGTIKLEISILDAIRNPDLFRSVLRNSSLAISSRLYNEIESLGEDLQILELSYLSNTYHIFTYRGRVFNDRLSASLFPFIFLSTREIVSTEDNAKRFSELKRSRQDGILVEALKVIESRLQSLELFYDASPMIYGEIGLKEPIPLVALGEGMGRIAALVLAIGNAKDGVVVVDEIENGLHYSVLTDVWKSIATAAHEFNVQIFATTHSLECIHAAHQAFSESQPYDFALHRLDRKKTGEIQAVTFSADTLETALEGNFEVR